MKKGNYKKSKTGLAGSGMAMILTAVPVYFVLIKWKGRRSHAFKKNNFLSDSYPAFFLLIATTSNKNF